MRVTVGSSFMFRHHRKLSSHLFAQHIHDVMCHSSLFQLTSPAKASTSNVQQQFTSHKSSFVRSYTAAQSCDTRHPSSQPCIPAAAVIPSESVTITKFFQLANSPLSPCQSDALVVNEQKQQSPPTTPFLRRDLLVPRHKKRRKAQEQAEEEAKQKLSNPSWSTATVSTTVHPNHHHHQHHHPPNHPQLNQQNQQHLNNNITNMTVTSDQQTKQQEFEQYMTDHKIDALFNELTQSLIEQKPDNPIDFITNQLEAKRRAHPYRKVVFVLGGPGSGKGTQCSKLVEQFGFVHFSAGDLLRAESESDSETGQMIRDMIREGQIVPGHITIGLLRKAIFSHPNSESTTFLIDGFPREIKQALDFEREVTPCQFVLFFDCPEQVLEERLLNRGLTSGRSDDNIESIRKRFNTYQKQTMPVIDYFAAGDRVKHVVTSKPVHEVFEEVRGIFGL